MNSLNKKLLLGTTAASMIIAAAPVLAMQSAVTLKSNTTLRANVSSSTISTSLKSEADNKIDARINALNNLKSRIDDTKKMGSDGKAVLDATITASINDMTALKAKIDADTDQATYKEDVKSLTKDYRIYLLVMPQGRIMAAADRITNIASLMTALSTQLQAKISTGQAAGKDATSVNASLSDYNSKVADANVQAQAAINEISSLKPDGGDKTIFQSNQTVLKDARTKIHAGMADLKTARQDAANIVKILRSWNISTSASASSTTPAAANK